MICRDCHRDREVYEDDRCVVCHRQWCEREGLDMLDDLEAELTKGMHNGRH